MSFSLAQHLALIEDEYAAALAFPLSSRKAALLASLLDNFADRAFAAWRDAAPAKVFGAEDVLAYRARVGAACPAMAAVFALGAHHSEGPRLVTGPVEVPLADYHRLSVEDFMVSLYNGHTVQRVLIMDADGNARLAHGVLGEAVAWWRAAGVAEG